MLFCLPFDEFVMASTCWSCQEGWYNFQAADSGSYYLNLISFHSCLGVAFMTFFGLLVAELESSSPSMV